MSNPKEAYEDIIIRNTIDMVLNKPQRLIEQLRERLKIESFDLSEYTFLEISRGGITGNTIDDTYTA